MKRIIFILAIILVALQQISGQVPQLFSYQAVLRNADGTVIANQAVDIRIKLLKGSATGTEVYSEVKSNITTSAQGVVALSIGDGNPTTFAAVPWLEKIFIQIEVKKSSENNYVSMGTSQILSVPFSLYALSAGSVKEVASPTSAGADDPIFSVKNKDGKIVFAVYQTGVRVYVEDSPTVKGAKGGFAVGGLSNQAKTGSSEYFRITSDSARIYINDLPGKGAKGGFAVGGLSNQAKSVNKDYFKVTQDTSFFKTTVYTQSNILTTGTVSTGAGTNSAPLTDLDGNIYQTIQIGKQIWMKDNLYTTKYADGTPIAAIDMAVYDNLTNPDSIKTYGRLYSATAIMPPNYVCPIGWHVPTQATWDSLLVFVGGNEWINNKITTGLKLIEPSTFWYNAISANNVSGFSGRPGGQGTPPWSSFPWSFSNKGYTGNWWGLQAPLMSVSLSGTDGSLNVQLGVQVYLGSPSAQAYSVRCVKGAPIPSK